MPQIFPCSRLVILAQRAIAAAMRGLSDTMGPEARATIGEEIDGMLKEAIDIANTKHLDRYIFSGFTTDTEPFVETLANPADPTSLITGAVYKSGNTAFQAIRRDIGPGETITVNIDGYATFQNFIDTLISVRDSLAANDMVTLRTGAEQLDISLNQVTLATTINGSRIRDLEGAQDSYLPKQYRDQGIDLAKSGS